MRSHHPSKKNSGRKKKTVKMVQLKFLNPIFSVFVSFQGDIATFASNFLQGRTFSNQESTESLGDLFRGFLLS